MDKRLYSPENQNGVVTFSLLSPGTRLGYAVMILCITAPSTSDFRDYPRLFFVVCAMLYRPMAF